MFLGEFIVKYRIPIVLIFIAAAIFLGYLGITNLTINSDLAGLAPQGNSFYTEQIDFLAEKLSSNTLTVIAYTDNNIPKTKAALQILKDRFENTDHIIETMKLDNPELFIKYGFLAIDSTGLKTVSDTLNLSVENMLDFSEWRKVITSFSTAQQLLEEYISQQGIDQYTMLSPDNRVMVINFVLKDNIIDVGNVSNAIQNLKKIANQVTKETGVRFLFTGTAVGVYESNEQVKKDFFLTTSISFIGICLLIYFGYGSLWILIFLMISMAVAMCITLGIVKLFSGEINIVTSFVNAMILGLGIDYGIHMITKITSHSQSGKIEEKSIVASVKEFFRPALAALMTTIGAFSSMFFGLSKPFMQMSIFSIVGVVSFFSTMLFFLPALLIIIKPKFKEKGKNRRFDFSFLVAGRTRKILRFIAIGAIVVFLPLGIINLKNYWYTPSGLVSEKSESSIAFSEVKKSFQKVGFGEICVIADNLEELERISNLIKNSGFMTTPLSMMSILEYASYENIDKLPSVYSDLFQIVNNPVLTAVFKKVGVYRQILEMLSMAKNSKNLQDVINELKKDVPMLFYEKDGVTKYVLYTDTTEDLYKENRIKRVFNFFKENNVQSYGYPTILYSVMNDMRGTIYWIALLVSAGVLVMLLIDTKSLKMSAAILACVMAAVVIAFGIGYVLEIHASFMTLLLIPILVGIGVDGMIHIKHISESNSRELISRTLKSITFCTFTTVAAFGSFSLAEGKLLQEFGILMGIGLSASWLITVFIAGYLLKGGDQFEDSDVH